MGVLSTFCLRRPAVRPSRSDQPPAPPARLTQQRLCPAPRVRVAANHWGARRGLRYNPRPERGPQRGCHLLSAAALRQQCPAGVPSLRPPAALHLDCALAPFPGQQTPQVLAWSWGQEFLPHWRLVTPRPPLPASLEERIKILPTPNFSNLMLHCCSHISDSGSSHSANVCAHLCRSHAERTEVGWSALGGPWTRPCRERGQLRVFLELTCSGLSSGSAGHFHAAVPFIPPNPPNP